jgi:myo-inositol-1(or 4)-monophosphatase
VTSDELLAIARHAAVSAGELLSERPARLATETKSSPTDIVTQMDLAAESLIADIIRSARPDDGILGEEGADRVGSSGVRWVVDPLDGTVNYLYGLPGWAVSVAAEVAGAVVAAAVSVPTWGETFTATAGGGAWSDGRRLRVSAVGELETALVATGFGYDAAERAAQAAAVARLLPRVRDIRRYGAAAADLCLLAAGRVDAYFERGLQPWDHAAGALIAAEAGAVVEFGAPVGERVLVLAAPPRILARFRDLLAEVDA